MEMDSSVSTGNIKLPSDFDCYNKNKKTLNRVSFGKYNVIISEKELKLLENKYKEYVQNFGVEIGFFNYFLNIGN